MIPLRLTFIAEILLDLEIGAVYTRPDMHPDLESVVLLLLKHQWRPEWGLCPIDVARPPDGELN